MELGPAAHAAIWGFLGALIYALPKWGTCVVAAKPGARHGFCTLELFVTLVVGAVAAAAFLRLALTTFHIPDENAVATAIGFVANHPAARPVILKRLLGATGLLEAPRTPTQEGK